MTRVPWELDTLRSCVTPESAVLIGDVMHLPLHIVRDRFQMREASDMSKSSRSCPLRRGKAAIRRSGVSEHGRHRLAVLGQMLALFGAARTTYGVAQSSPERDSTTSKLCFQCSYGHSKQLGCFFHGKAIVPLAELHSCPLRRRKNAG